MRLWPFGSAREAAQEPAAAAVADPFAGIIEALLEPLMVVRAEDQGGRRITFANSAARELFRIETEAPMLVAAIRNPSVLAAVEETLLAGGAGEAAFELQDRMMRALSRPLGLDESGARQALLLIRDETDARRSERMRADFLANASHELRTPLASVTGFIETLQGHARDDEAARDKFLAIMAAQAERMGRLIDDLMSLSRIELNEHVPPAGNLDVGLVAGEVAEALSPLARKSGVSIAVSAPALGVAGIEGDRDQILQVIQNLVDNALKYSPAGGVVSVEVLSEVTAEAALAPRDDEAARLSLLAPEHDEASRFVAIRVTDQGQGIIREQLPRLTERFYRTPGQKSGDRSGTGLGLAIVKHIVNRHRGGLAVESAPARGASFIVYLPRASGTLS